MENAMDEARQGDVRAHSPEMLVETPDVRMVTRALAPGQETPWHWHSSIERVFGMQGTVIVEMRAPRELIEIAPGEIGAVPPKRAHRLRNGDGGGCSYALLHGVGPYDYHLVGG
jgi:quercetin dioxygenase-like cupin family protein